MRFISESSSAVLCRTLLVLCAAVSGGLGKAHAIDLIPGELEPRPAGRSVVQTIYTNQQRQGFYSNGNKVLPTASADADLLQLRLAHAFSLGDYPAVVYVQQPWGHVKAEGLPGASGSANGSADTMLLFGLWPYANRETGTYFAVGAYFFVNDGNYDNHRNVNLGENRSKYVLQAAYQMRLAERLDWAFAADAMQFGDNANYGTRNARLSQDPLWTLQTSLNYRFAPVTAMALALFRSVGGETQLNGVDRHDATRVDRWQVTGSYLMPDIAGAVHLQYGRDFSTQNGLLETRRLVLRFSKSF